MQSIFAERMNNLGTETAFEVFVKANKLEAQGKDIVHLELGEPDFDTPRNITDAAINALNNGYTHYTPSGGFPKVREAIAEYISKQKEVPVESDEVVIVPGGKPIIFFSILSLVNPGDEVICPNPSYPIYESVIRLVGGKPIPLSLTEERGFRFDKEELKNLITARTKMIVINSPNNPTGGIMDREHIQAIADIVRGKGIIVLADEIYDRIIYTDDKPVSIASMPGMKDWTIILDGFSKTYAMTGWRIGYGVMHKDIAAKITRLMSNTNSCTAAFTQIAAMEALQGPQDEVLQMVEQFRKRRDYIVDGLNSIPGVNCFRPEGSFYVFPNVSSYGKKSKEMADYLLNEAGVACLGGTDFGSNGEGYIRLSYANSLENIEKALSRIDLALKKIR